jgi:hypothetical protein
MSQAAVFIACQMPDKSGVPSGVRRTAPACGAVRVWPTAGNGASHKSTAWTNTAAIQASKGFLI